MKKKILFTILGIFLLASATAIITLDNGNKILTKSELEGLTDQQIDNYFQNNLVMIKKTIVGNKMLVDYNITYLEPDHKGGYNVFTQVKRFTIQSSLWEKCINRTTKSSCKDYLIERTTPYYLIENDSYISEVTEYNNVSLEQEINITDEFGNITTINETYYQLEPYQINKTFYEITNTTIKSTYLQASEELDKQKERAKAFRDEAIYNPLEELDGLI